MTLIHQPTPEEVGAAIVEDMRNDERLGAVENFDTELRRRIADAVHGERLHARRVFDFYAIPCDEAPRRGPPKGARYGSGGTRYGKPEALGDIDFEIVALAYRALGWKWAVVGVPTATDLRDAAERAIREVQFSDYPHCESGGIRVERCGDECRVAFARTLCVAIKALKAAAERAVRR